MSHLIRPTPPGYVQMKQFLMSEAERNGIGPTGVFYRIKAGKYPRLKRIEFSKRLVFVINCE